MHGIIKIKQVNNTIKECMNKENYLGIYWLKDPYSLNELEAY